MDKTYHIITFGCQMNERDSETLAGYLEERGYVPADSRKTADLVLINTCSVRENADKRFFGTLGQLKHHKEEDPSFLVGVCGCMMQQPRIVAQVKEKYPWVDLVFGTNTIHRFPALLDNALKARKHATAVDIREEGGEIVEGMPARRLYAHKGFVNIMFGCNNFCTYCIVPYTRGRERSRTPEHVVEEVRSLVAGGAKEVTLLGQNVNSYRSGGTDFAALLKQVEAVEGLSRIRFMTSHPKDISDALIEAFGTSEKLCKHIHLPLQSGSDRVLARMNRHYTAEKYLRIVERLREAAPEIAISTDIIVGFPGETEEDFEETLRVAEAVRYDSAFTFLYSIRPGTPAAEYPDQIPEEVKHARFDRLVDLINECSLAKNETLVGRVLPVLAEGASKRDKEALSGRTDGFKLVNFRGPEELAGRIVPVRITGAKTFSLTGELTEG